MSSKHVGVIVIVGILCGCRASTEGDEAADEAGASEGSSGESSGGESSGGEAASESVGSEGAETGSEAEDTSTGEPMPDMAEEMDPIVCSEVPASPLSTQQLGMARGYHDVAFDGQGHIIGSDGFALVKVDADDNLSLFTPNLGQVQQMDWLDDGDLAVAADSNQSIMRVTAAGATSTIAANVGAYGLITGDDGMLYAANYASVLRIDPESGTQEVVVAAQGLSPRVVGFSPDNTKLYIGTGVGWEPVTFSGDVYAVDWEPDTMQPLGDPYVFASGVGTGDYHDSMAVDACGNLYVSDFVSATLYRVTPSGEVSEYLEFGETFSPNYGHGARFGRGEGWHEDALYMPLPYGDNRVLEVVVGVPSRAYAHLARP
jgi:hypothetical protein